MIQSRTKLIYGTLTTVGVLLLLLLAVGSAAAEKPNTAVQFDALSVICAEGEIVLSDEPLFAGPGTAEATITEKGEIFVDAVQYPSAYPGSSWVAPGRGRFTPTGFFVNHRGYGTGDLEGGIIVYRATPPEEPVELPCDPVGPVVKLAGVIILPPGLGRVSK